MQADEGRMMAETKPWGPLVGVTRENDVCFFDPKDAREIVRRCEAHDALVKALEHALVFCDPNQSPPKFTRMDLLGDIRAALKLAKEGK